MGHEFSGEVVQVGPGVDGIFEAGALVEPLAVGVHAACQAGARAGQAAVGEHLGGREADLVVGASGAPPLV